MKERKTKQNKTKKKSPKWPVNQIRLLSVNILTLSMFCTFPFSRSVSFSPSFSILTFCLHKQLVFSEVNDMLITLLICENNKQSARFYILHEKKEWKRLHFRSVSNFVVQLNVFSCSFSESNCPSHILIHTHTHILTQTSNIIDNNITFVCLPWAY